MKSPGSARAAVLCCFIAAQGCKSDSIVPAGYQGQALFSVRFSVETRDAEAFDELSHPRWGLFRMLGGSTGRSAKCVSWPTLGPWRH